MSTTDKLFVRTTQTFVSPEEVQSSRITIYVYDSVDIAKATFVPQLMSAESFDTLLENKEGFFKKTENDYTNIYFLEVRKIQYHEDSAVNDGS